MINDLTLHNFKNHNNSEIRFGNLTILTGVNGAGKSSIIQSLLLLRDSYLRNDNLKTLYLNGPSFDLGRSVDAVNRNCDEDVDKLKIKIKDDTGKSCQYVYQYPEDSTSSLKLIEAESQSEGDLVSFPLLNDNFQYISAFRNGPLEVYTSDTDVVDEHNQLSSKKGIGDMVVYYLAKNGNNMLRIPELALPGTVNNSLSVQTEAWLGKISEGVSLKIDQHGNQYNLLIGNKQQDTPTSYFSAINTGFGISYILSVIVAILSSAPNSLVIIENPEAHIHPAGQSALMELISLAAMNGVQIILETHSDHIINGALVNWKKHSDWDNEKLHVYFFERDEHLNAKPILLTISKDGRIKRAPKGFFDQMDSDLEVLFDMN